VYTDSLAGIPRDQVPAQFRYSSRNLRQLYQALFNAVSGPTAEIPRPFPIALQSIPSGSSISGEMLVGTMDFFRLTAPASGAAERLTFSRPDGAAFDPSLHAQVSVFRCPSAEACP
jgi:hypothetical protein